MCLNHVQRVGRLTGEKLYQARDGFPTPRQASESALSSRMQPGPWTSKALFMVFADRYTAWRWRDRKDVGEIVELVGAELLRTAAVPMGTNWLQIRGVGQYLLYDEPHLNPARVQPLGTVHAA